MAGYWLLVSMPVHVCLEKVKMHTVRLQGGVSSLERMGCPEYLENLLKKACILAE